MEIKYFGKRAFLIKGKKESALVNPDETFLTKDRPRIVIMSETKVEVDGAEGERVVVMGPGEYETGGIEINGYSAGSGATFYSVTADGVIVGILGRLKEALTDKRIEKIGGVDVLVADIGEGSGTGAKTILNLAKKWGANYVIPVGYDSRGGELKKFMVESDAEGQEALDSLKVDKDTLPEGTEVIILKGAA
jgi:L-ascorbate metabolism protein UlaG (beta-lactamase superfamily)